ncbi:WecB/TagA/CpsF family glycosyltransferase [Solibacillus silvestris]|uniref:WecB/TagA/CpsF family glycosyltransferase n=1 Tax=Solibacillus silvestris TaxID=76853 RepID=UPI003F7EB5C6
MMSFIEKELFLESKHALLDVIITNTKQKKKKAYYAINADCMLNYWKDNEYCKIINETENVVYVDGMGVIYAQKFLKLHPAKERIATTDLFPALVEVLHNCNSDIRIFLLGGEKDTAKRVKNNMLKKYPKVNIVGTHHGYFNKMEESANVINLINSLNVDILFVGFGNPVQEKWVHSHFDFLQANTVITCGGLFDYYSNNVKRAPLFMQKLGFEWLYRFLQEPRRLYRRYIFGNVSYLSKVFYLKLKLKA